MHRLLTSIMILGFLGCTSQKKEVLIDSQKILYDSTKISDKSFKITVITTLKYKNNTVLTAEDLDGFYILANKDTLDLKNNNTPPSKVNSLIKIEYRTLLKQREKEYNNIIFVKDVENWQIKNRNTNVVLKKSPDYKIVSLIALWEHNNPNEIQ